MMYRSILLFLVGLVMFLSAAGQDIQPVTIRVVSADTTSTVESEASLPLPDLTTNLSIVIGEFIQKPRFESIYTEKVFFKVKRYSKLKTFEIILQDYVTHQGSEQWFLKHEELKNLKKQRWIYEGTQKTKDFELLDSLSKLALNSIGRGQELRRPNGVRYSPRRFSSAARTVISDFYLEPNPDADNFLLHVVNDEDTIRIPVAMLLETTNAKKIQRSYGFFYSKYKTALDKRMEEWREIKDEYAAYSEDYQNSTWTQQELAGVSNYRPRLVRSIGSFIGRFGTIMSPLINSPGGERVLFADYYTEEGDSLTPSSVYVLDYTLNTVYVFDRIRDVCYFPTSQFAVIVFDDQDQMGILKSSELKKARETRDKKQLVFDMAHPADLSFAEIQELGQ